MAAIRRRHQGFFFVTSPLAPARVVICARTHAQKEKVGRHESPRERHQARKGVFFFCREGGAARRVVIS